MSEPLAPVVVCALAVAGLLGALYRGHAPATALCKLVASAAFVWAALAWGAASSGYGRTLLAGLALCAVGDALLLPAGRAGWFRLGLGAFLLGHAAYIAAFLRMPLDPTALVVAGLLVAPAGLAVHRWLGPRLPGSLRGPVAVYLGVIAGMLVCAVAAARGGGCAAIAFGAVAFAVSDLSVARDRFVTAGFSNSLWGLPLYFGAQLALASSAGWAPA